MTVAASLTGGDDKVKQLQDDTQDGHKDTPLKSYFGVSQADTDDSLKAGARGPTLLEDIHFREKVSHFDHERIPERVVHARGTGAHGYFTLHTAIPEYTYASLFNDTTRTTSTFVRFSTVQGARGSADTVRDVRGFATRFYTPEGNYDIVGNNIPVFFIQDAIKFPDVIHAVKPEPHNEIPQGATAHDNAWDFFSLAPETAHMVMWTFSDRSIPRSFRHMPGFGVHTFVFVNAKGERHFVKFHWKPKLGTHSLVWDEALKLAGQDPDFHRRDLYDSIDAGAYPQWEFGIQVVPENDADKFEFDLLDATKFIPEDILPVKYIGTLTLNKKPEEFFPEVEQVAFCTQHMIPGVEHSNDPLLQGRAFSYFDTQLSRLGGPNFGDIPINRPICPVFNFQRGGQHRRIITTGHINYYPNRDANNGAHPVPPDEGGYLVSGQPIESHAHKTRARGPKFAEHWDQATLFYNSLSTVEKQHLVATIGFELGKVEDIRVHKNVIAYLNNIDNDLARKVAVQISIPPPDPVKTNHGHRSDYLSLLSPRNTFSASGRKIGIYVLDGFSPAVVIRLQAEILAIGSVPVIVGPRVGLVKSEAAIGSTEITKIDFHAQSSFETSRSTHWDAAFFASGSTPEYAQALAKSGRLIYAAREAYAHQKPIGVVGIAVDWLENVVLPGELVREVKGEEVSVVHGVVLSEHVTEVVVGEFVDAFLKEVAKHRAWDRDVSHIAA
ncbi:uncharacterized protein EI90DRAFT_3146600 [Cantharellus anzutake]|uniref:uncharacterized protein n=1 Tax=Cantharellus anzutake TaxID=1750568 RepID=UPI001903A936|nr:uncharacterized protein EI90DRAFT_3146600 [Cantharellus anzutake]KAF8325754.1 hypothetical protein EI90DRAFT_3146600 [Cantharellus anzutake]